MIAAEQQRPDVARQRRNFCIARRFVGYVQQCLAPALQAGDVVVMDNLSSHKSEATRRAIEAVGATLWYLPPYSPDLNPIEKLWRKVKTWLRRLSPQGFDAIGQALAQALRHVTSKQCANYFRSCGYGR